MSYHSILLDRVHIVRWQKPELADTLPLVREVRQAAERLGKNLIGIPIVPEDIEPPTDEARAAMAKRMNEILEVSDSVHFVVEGTGFRPSILRSALSGILLVGGKRGRVLVHKNIDQALKLVAPQVGMTPDLIKKLAKQKGMNL
jgi:hypothetical protein